MPGGDLISRLDRLELLIRAEVKASVDRVLRTQLKVEELGADLGYGRSTMYDRLGTESPVPVEKLGVLGVHDTDPEVLLRVGNLFYQAAAEIANNRKCKGRGVVVSSVRLDFGADE